MARTYLKMTTAEAAGTPLTITGVPRSGIPLADPCKELRLAGEGMIDFLDAMDAIVAPLKHPGPRPWPLH
jgi:hypothetical protein